MDRYGVQLPAGRIGQVRRSNIADYPDEKKMFNDSITGHTSHHDWYQSKLVQTLYDSQKEDISHEYNIAVSEPIRNPATHEIVGVWINIVLAAATVCTTVLTGAVYSELGDRAVRMMSSAVRVNCSSGCCSSCRPAFPTPGPS
jgi:hypothetical protein